MKSILGKDCSIGEHEHKTSSEIIYVISGEAKCILDGKEEIVKKENVIIVKKVVHIK